MKHTLIFLISAVVMLGGCASGTDYKLYTAAQTQIETARYNADAERYRALAAIAASGTETAKVAAVMSLSGLGGGGGNGSGRTQLEAPVSDHDAALKWASILVPSLVQGVGVFANKQIQITQSNNNAAQAISANNTFAAIAGKIQAPAANITTTTTTLGGNGTIGSGTFTSTDSHNTTTSANPTTSTTDNHSTVTTDNHTTNPTTITPAGKICTLNPTTNVLTCL